MIHISTNTLGYNQSQQIKRQKNGDEDGICGTTQTSTHIKRNPYTDGVPIELHHEDGDIRNNTSDNLKILYPNCHSLTPTFRALNKKSERKR